MTNLNYYDRHAIKRQSKRLNLENSLSPAQCRAARALLGISQTDLATVAKISRQTVVDFERGARTPYTNNLSAIRTALEAAGVLFIDQNGEGPGVRLKKQRHDT